MRYRIFLRLGVRILSAIGRNLQIGLFRSDVPFPVLKRRISFLLQHGRLVILVLRCSFLVRYLLRRCLFLVLTQFRIEHRFLGSAGCRRLGLGADFSGPLRPGGYYSEMSVLFRVGLFWAASVREGVFFFAGLFSSVTYRCSSRATLVPLYIFIGWY